MSIVRVENTTKRVLGLPQMGKHLPKPLLPGGNNVAEGHLVALQDNKAVNHWVEMGWIIIHSSGEGDPEGPKPPESLEAYGDEGAMKLIALETDPSVIKIWRDNDLRPKVVQAMNERIAQLTRPAHMPDLKSPSVNDDEDIHDPDDEEE